MNISSAQPTCSITSSSSNDVFTIDLSSITTSSGSIGTITLSNTGASGGYTLASGSGFTQEYVSDWKIPKEWIDAFPDWDRIQKMCDEYPGLKIAFERFKTTYLLVKDDYDAPPNKKIRP